MATKTATSKSTKVKAIPNGYHSVTPYLIIDGAARALDFYKQRLRRQGADAHARRRATRSATPRSRSAIAVIMLADEHPEMGARSPGHFGGSPVSIMIYVEDVDQPASSRPSPAGGTELRPLTDQFYGDRSGTLKDPFGHSWHHLHPQGRRQHGRNEPPHGSHEERLARGQVLNYDISPGVAVS